MKIVNFAGSFDPIHDGHIQMIKKAYKVIQPDIFYITPISKSFTKTYSTTYRQRADMIALALKDLQGLNVQINYCEEIIDEGESGYKHIRELKKYSNAEELYIVIGADHLADLHTWDEIEWLSKNVTFYVFARRNLPLSDYAKKLIANGHMIFDDSYDFEVGSYAQRVTPSFLNYDVIQYINQHGLYYFQRLQSRLTKKRIEHSIRVANLAKAYAEKFAPTLVQKAYVAGLFHDWCKQMPDAQIKTIIKNTKYEAWLDKFHRINNLHGIAAALILKSQLFFEDAEILHAITNHTMPFDEEVNTLDMILYCADKLEPERKEEDLTNIETVRKLAWEDLKQAYNHIKNYQTEKFTHQRR